MPKMTHVAYVVPTGNETTTDHIEGGRFAVYGKRDLARHQKAAREAGAKLHVREISQDES